MPALPTLNLSDAHFARVVNAFPGTTNAEKAAAYNRWLTNNLIDFVMRAELDALEVTLNAEFQAQQTAMQETRRLKREAVIASLPPRI